MSSSEVSVGDEWHLFDDVPIGEPSLVNIEAENHSEQCSERVEGPEEQTYDNLIQDDCGQSPMPSNLCTPPKNRPNGMAGDSAKDPFESLTMREKIRLKALQMNMKPRKVCEGLEDADGTVELDLCATDLVSNSSTKSMFSKLFNKTKKVQNDNSPDRHNRVTWFQYREKMRKEIATERRKVWEQFQKPLAYNEDEEFYEEKEGNAVDDIEQEGEEENDSLGVEREFGEVNNFEDLEREDAMAENEDDEINKSDLSCVEDDAMEDDCAEDDNESECDDEEQEEKEGDCEEKISFAKIEKKISQKRNVVDDSDDENKHIKISQNHEMKGTEKKHEPATRTSLMQDSGSDNDDDLVDVILANDDSNDDNQEEIDNFIDGQDSSDDELSATEKPWYESQDSDPHLRHDEDDYDHDDSHSDDDDFLGSRRSSISRSNRFVDDSDDDF